MKKSRSRLLSLVLSGTCLFSVAARADERSMILSGKEARRVFLQCSRDSPRRAKIVWKVSARDVQTLESLLPKFLKTCKAPHTRTPLFNYYRQYAGFVRNGRKMVYIDAFNAFAGGSDLKYWRRDAIVVCDGGPHYFGLEYDVQSRKFGNLFFNGEA